MKPLLMLLAMTTIAFAAPLPHPKTGQCPAGYTQSGGYCSPMRGTTRPAIPKIPGQQCPSGWMQSGGSCLGPL